MDEEENLIFPKDVYTKVKVSGQVTTRDKVALGIFLAVLVNVGLFIFIPTLMYGVFNSLLLGIFVVILLDALVGYFVLKKFVLKEDQMRNDLSKDKSESFTRFFKVCKDVKETAEVSGYGITPIYQYTTGELMSCLRFRYGTNNPSRTRHNEQILTDIFNAISSRGCDYKTVTMTEKYSSTEECEEFKKSLSNVNNVSLSKTMSEIASGIIEDCDRMSSLDCLTILITTRSSEELPKLVDILNMIMDIIFELPNGFREISFLQEDKFIEACVQYYGMETIDMSMITAIAPTRELTDKIDSVLRVVKLVTEDGKEKVNTRFEKLYLKRTSRDINN